MQDTSRFAVKSIVVATMMALPIFAYALDPIDTDDTCKDVIVDAGEVGVINSKGFFAVISRNGNLAQLTGQDLTINAKGGGVRALGAIAVGDEFTSSIVLGNEQTQSITINAGKVDSKPQNASGISAVGTSNATVQTGTLSVNVLGKGTGNEGIAARNDGSNIQIDANNVVVKVSADFYKDKSMAYGIQKVGEGKLNINAKNSVYIGARTEGNAAYVVSEGLRVAGGGSVNVTGQDIFIEGISTNQAAALRVSNGAMTVGQDNSTVKLVAKSDNLAFGIFSPTTSDDEHAKTFVNGKTIDIVSNGGKTGIGITLENRSQALSSSQELVLGNKNSVVSILATAKDKGGEATGVRTMYNNSKLTIDGSELVINAKAAEGSAIGIAAMIGHLNETKAESSIIINSDRTVIRAEGGEYSAAIQTTSQGHVAINGHLDAQAENVIMTRGLSSIEINKANAQDKVINLKGNINFNTENFNKPESETTSAGSVVINLTNAQSSWEGGVLRSYGTKPSDSNFDLSDVRVSLSNGAQWTPVTIESIENTEGGQKPLTLDSLSMNDGIVNITGNDVQATVDNLSGKGGTVNLATTKTDAGLLAGSFEATNTKNEVLLDVNLTNSDMTAELTSDEITSEQAKDLMGNVVGDKVQTSTSVPEGMINPGFAVDAQGQSHQAQANTLMQSSLELAAAVPLALNRIMMNDVRKRLGDIRTTEGTHGVWARYDGGKLTGEGSLKNDFNTIQVGMDTVPMEGSARMGVAFSYTDSDAEYARGNADMKAYSIAMYGTKMFESGMFFDVIGRMGTADTDLTVDGKHKGTMDNVVLGVSGEVGWRFDVNDMFYVEPQAEMTYTYVNGENLKLSTASYEVDSVNSLMGRLGFAAGLKCPADKGNVYVRASAVHEFLGDSKITGTNLGQRNSYEIDGQDTWVEYGIGANLNLTKSTYVWADVERTTGGALDEDWRATVGVRYAF